MKGKNIKHRLMTTLQTIVILIRNIVFKTEHFDTGKFLIFCNYLDNTQLLKYVRQVNKKCFI